MNLNSIWFYVMAKPNIMNVINKKSFFIFSLFLIMIGGNSWAQVQTATIRGDVYSGKKTNFLSGALIRLDAPDLKFSQSTKSDSAGHFEFTNLKAGSYKLKATYPGFETFRRTVAVSAGKTITRDIRFTTLVIVDSKDVIETEEIELAPAQSHDRVYRVKESRKKLSVSANSSVAGGYYHRMDQPAHNTEAYDVINENVFKAVKVNPLSTFSVDVDAASYSNVRRFILNGTKPDKGAVRVEEMINYFNYDYPNPVDNHPFSITTEIGACPWSKNKLVHVGLQGKRIDKSDLPPSNLVFLLDVSGSMGAPNKLPLLKKSFSLLVSELTDRDRVSIVVYAGAAGVVLKPTKGSDGTTIMEALENLNAGGSTAGGAGIKLAYKTARENFIKGGNNRVILATDGDFNIGMSSNSAMEDLIVKERESGIFLTCLGFGMGNYKDSKMEILADKGNGNYAYIDNLLEAKKVLVTEMGATLLTIAKDVKIQVEFNPEVIESYRLIGYENRLLNDEDFNDDSKDAGEIGAGHSVTALYEVVLKGQGTGVNIDDLKYQNNEVKGGMADEMLTVKFRYKAPDGDKSKLIERVLPNKIDANNSDNFNFSAAVAGFGMLLRDSEYKGTLNFEQVIKMAEKAKGDDKNGYRAQFIQLVDAAKTVCGG